MGDPLDVDKWMPPSPPLSVNKIQRGLSPVIHVENEKAAGSFGPALKHWSALPALSYFLLNAVNIRENGRRIRSPMDFKPPPRVTLSDQRKHEWIADLANPAKPLRKLARAIPHGYSASKLIDVLCEHNVPLHRALWFTKCVGANEVRALKRKAASTGSDNVQIQAIEARWLEEWTQAVVTYFEATIDSFDSLPADQWQRRIAYVTRFTLHLFYEALIYTPRFLQWVLDSLKQGPVTRLPCIVHLVHLLWKPLTTTKLAPVLLRCVAAQYRLNSASSQLDSVAFRLMSTNEDIFVAPRTWPAVEPHVRQHPAYQQLKERNDAFVPQDEPLGPKDWAQQLQLGNLFNMFARPFNMADFMASLYGLNLPHTLLVRTILLGTVRRDTVASTQLCVAVLKRLKKRDNVSISDICIEFLFGPELHYIPRNIGDVVSELICAHLICIDTYFSRLIAKGTMYMDHSARAVHVCILQNLPYDSLSPSSRAQARMLLRRAGCSTTEADISSLVSQCSDIFRGKPCSVHLGELALNDRHRLANELVKVYDTHKPQEQSILTQVCDIMEQVGSGSVRYLYKVLCIAITDPMACSAIVSCALRQVHMRLLAFVSSKLSDAFAMKLVDKLKVLNDEEKSTAWVNWDDISALRDVIRAPGTMFELSRLIPLRHRPSVAEHTPMETETVSSALYRPGAPDISALVSLKDDEGYIQTIVEYAKTAHVEKLALLQLVTYRCISLEDLSNIGDLALFRFLLLAHPGELGFCFEEIEELESVRRAYLETADVQFLLKVIASVDAIKFASNFANSYPDIYINRLVQPALALKGEILLQVRRATMSDERKFEVLLLRCNPFNLRYYQGLVLLGFNGMSDEDIAAEVFAAAKAHPETSAALQGLLQCISVETKNVIFTLVVREFLTDGFNSENAAAIDTIYTLVSILASSVVEPLTWDLALVPSFLESLARISKEIQPHEVTGEKASRLRKALTVLLRVCVVARLHGVKQPKEALPFLEALIQMPVFGDSYHVHVFLTDALRLLRRIASLEASDSRQWDYEEDTPGCPLALKNLRVYSKRQDRYEPIPIWPCDLIEDANPVMSKNDGPINLSLFETYEGSGD